MTSFIHVNKSEKKEVISRHIYGHFAEHLGRCIYEGIWVGEDSSIPNTRGIRNDVVEALRKLNIPNLRWPGGCFADEYHWKDGIGPRESRPSIVNNNWGKVVENNHFGTHEFLDLCEQLDTEPYICGNVGSGTVQEMQEWVEYITFDGESPMANLRRENGRDQPWKLKYFGVGNENWGCGGKMRVEYYADVYRRYQTFVRSYTDTPIYKIACGPQEADYHWTEVMMREGLGRTEPIPDEVVTDIWEHHRPEMDGLALHFYTRNRANYDSATEFTEEKWFDYMKRTLVMEELVEKHTAIMDKYDPEKTVDLIVDEWGTWFKVEPGTNPGFLYQQNTLRDALVAGINLNIFNNRCDRVHMANIAQMVNVLQAMILTEGEKMILTPSYHVFEMYKVHQDATLLRVSVSTDTYTYGEDSVPMLNVSASQDESGKVHISVCNLDPNNAEPLTCNLDGIGSFSKASGRVLTAEAMNAHNTFSDPNRIKPEAFDEIELKDNEVSVTVPSKSVLVFEVQ
ncbi:alpha-N-arabinofuranosidase [Aquibacillus koreensis]|uniref:non-reducing end alpha-L-arabinofuranosidase n=1 Tax=Aquibacillus koreensis TaxID=279446 RepID=A0A9X3WLJ4_9BACI|nr:alpha-N-arabinofuranosidase [Aquibacillus koreensis]MCT2534810.1 alpha-N-arabinofuranosidase [Aquibacillus koreensis]MDC3419579.1 alpha-N-arabinofuranosidase [Aquibacillus koreensis]